MKAFPGRCNGSPRRSGALRFSRLTPTLLALVLTVAVSWRAGAAGTWTPLANQPLTALRNALLLGDGTVMCGDGSRGWYRLTPDIHGSYVNGTWTSLATSHYSRYYYSSEVLTNGNVYIAGGEYDTGGDHAELYDASRNAWSDIPPPSSYPDYSDAISKILPNGNVLQGTTGSGTWIYNTVLNTITAGPAAARGQDETCWVKLPNDNILSVDGGSAGATKSEHYVPSLNACMYGRQRPGRVVQVMATNWAPAFCCPTATCFISAAPSTPPFTRRAAPSLPRERGSRARKWFSTPTASARWTLPRR